MGRRTMAYRSKVKKFSPKCTQGGQLVEHVVGANSMLEQLIAVLVET